MAGSDGLNWIMPRPVYLVTACVCSYCGCLSQLHRPNSHQWPWNGKLVLSHNYSNWLCCKTHTLVLWNVAVAYCAYEKECGLWGVKSQIFHWILQFSYLSLLLQRQCCRLKKIKHCLTHLSKILLLVPMVNCVWLHNKQKKNENVTRLLETRKSFGPRG